MAYLGTKQEGQNYFGADKTLQYKISQKLHFLHIYL